MTFDPIGGLRSFFPIVVWPGIGTPYIVDFLSLNVPEQYFTETEYYRIKLPLWNSRDMEFMV